MREASPEFTAFEHAQSMASRCPLEGLVELIRLEFFILGNRMISEQESGCSVKPQKV